MSLFVELNDVFSNRYLVSVRHIHTVLNTFDHNYLCLVVVQVLFLESLRLMYRAQSRAVFLAARRQVQALDVQVPVKWITTYYDGFC